MSQQVKLLEAAIGATLFERASRPVRLTEAGRLMLPACEGVFQRLDETIRELGELRRLERGQVVFGSGAYFSSYLLPPIYASFQRQAPGIRTLLYVGSPEDCIDRVRRGEVDIAVVGGDEFRDSGLITSHLAGKDLVWIARPDHPLASESDITLDRLVAESLILTPHGSGNSRRSLDRKAAESGLTLKASIELSGVEAQVTAVRGGLGIAAVPYHVIYRLEGASLVALQVQGFPLRLSRCVVSREGHQSSAAVALRDHVLTMRTQIEASSLSPRTVSRKALHRLDSGPRRIASAS